ncbi:hypothetical protein N7455_008581 [Penicillium solitum]|uniref:uncharacterized protein n=1 Tax=Penicillium solitum TaxID=60172 RepID=UPI0032C4823D|nr:hypothetical protein N7455_008581 [Penicillium solitum]
MWTAFALHPKSTTTLRAVFAKQFRKSRLSSSLLPNRWGHVVVHQMPSASRASGRLSSARQLQEAQDVSTLDCRA